MSPPLVGLAVALAALVLVLVLVDIVTICSGEWDGSIVFRPILLFLFLPVLGVFWVAKTVSTFFRSQIEMHEFKKSTDPRDIFMHMVAQRILKEDVVFSFGRNNEQVVDIKKQKIRVITKEVIKNRKYQGYSVKVEHDFKTFETTEPQKKMLMDVIKQRREIEKGKKMSAKEYDDQMMALDAIEKLMGIDKESQND